MVKKRNASQIKKIRAEQAKLRITLYKEYYLFCEDPTLLTFNKFLDKLPKIHKELNISNTSSKNIIEKLKEKHIINDK